MSGHSVVDQPLPTEAHSSIEADKMLAAQVAFPLLLDCYEFCSEELRKALDGPRDELQAIEDRKATAQRAGVRVLLCSINCDCMIYR